MLLIYTFMRPAFWILPWILQAIGYYFILKKMELKPLTALVPVAAEQQISKKTFKRRRTFYRPAVISAILIAAVIYLGKGQLMSKAFLAVIFIVYGLFLVAFYWRLGKSFGKGVFFRIMMILCPAVFLIILGKGKSEFTQLEFKPDKETTKTKRIVKHVAFTVLSIVETIVILGSVTFVCIRTEVPEFLVNMILDEVYTSTANITSTDADLITREDTLGADSKAITNAKSSRDYFFPDHSNDEDVVVMAYVIGADLEGGMGLASANIRQMIDATKRGDNLKFVIEAGGAKRWFTPGIADGSYGRYEIADGKITKIEDLPDTMTMSDGNSLCDFIKWSKENYPADRNMLVMWDHGGGLALGYGQDNINRGNNLYGTIDTDSIINAIKQADMKFDMIGFDACLMQDIEVANELEPYADYFIASEETEGGYGWYYTSAFGMLAENPGTPTNDFARELVGTYDPYTTAVSDGKVDTTATLSCIDLTLVSPAYDKLADFFAEAADDIVDDSSAYANIAIAANDTYAFHDNMQIDLVDFLEHLDNADYNDITFSHDDKMDLIQSIQASILMRNAASAKGINGVALAFPYKDISYYTMTHDQFKALKMDDESKAMDEIFSIIASQKKRDMEAGKKNNDGGLISQLTQSLNQTDYTKESWYISGFEKYDKANTFVDIPLQETEGGYQIQLPAKVWPNIVDCQTMIYQHVSEGTDADACDMMRYIGSDYIGDDDADGHPMVVVDGYWPHVGDQIMCYEAKPVRETEDGIVFNGTVRARLNDTTDIILYVDWEPVAPDAEEMTAAHITGYMLADDEDIPDTKGLVNLEAGDTIQFMFDYYDAEGNLVKSEPSGNKIHVTKQENIKIEYLPIEPGTIEFGGILTDIYQRMLTTEILELVLE